jgi:hypothetical protein
MTDPPKPPLEATSPISASDPLSVKAAQPLAVAPAKTDPSPAPPKRPNSVPEKKWFLMSAETQARLADLAKQKQDATALAAYMSTIRTGINANADALREALLATGDPETIERVMSADRAMGEDMDRAREDAKAAYDVHSKEFNEAMSHAMIEVMERSQELDRRQAEMDRLDAQRDRVQMRWIAAGSFVMSVVAIIISLLK